MHVHVHVVVQIRPRVPDHMCIIGASVSEPHTCGFNAAFSLYIHVHVCRLLHNVVCIVVRRTVSKIAISTSMFHLGFHMQRTHIAQCAPGTPPSPTNWPANGTVDVGRGERHGSQYALPVVIDCHPRLRRRWGPG